MKIPFVDLKRQYRNYKSEIDLAIQNVIDEGSFIGGKHVDYFETSFKSVVNVSHCISVANGTDSLYIIFKQLGIKEGDEVICPAISWISSSETITQVGAKVVFCDVNEYYTIDTSLVEKHISSKTKAILAVHLYGQACDIDPLVALCKKYNIFLIEDCAQSHLTKYNGQIVGSFGIAASYSFYPGKNLGAYGDAGCITTNDFDIARKFRLYSKHGALEKHKHEIEGINSRMDGLQAAILNVKINYLIHWNELRNKVAYEYNQRLSNIQGIVLPKILPNSYHTFHIYCIQADRRNELMKFLKENGVEVAIHYPTALPFLPAYSYLNHTLNEFPFASYLQDRILSLPIFPEMESVEIKFVCDLISKFYSIA